MNRIAEGFWVATALVTSTALLVVFMPIIAIVTLLALALPRIQRRRTSNDEASRFGGNEPVGQPKFRVIETTYTVID
jgi:hypothetical protein